MGQAIPPHDTLLLVNPPLPWESAPPKALKELL
jgi:hypothetical protein